MISCHHQQFFQRLLPKSLPTQDKRSFAEPRRLLSGHTVSATICSRPLQHDPSNDNRHRLRQFSSAAPQSDDGSTSESKPVALSSPKLQGLYDRIEKLPSDEVNILGALIIQMLGRTIFPGEFGGGGGGGAGMVAGGPAVEDAAPVEEVKTIFDVKLVAFDAKAKIKVIKEVRAIAGLGLKEAKELVESAPKIISKGLKQDKADELKAQLEAAGAEVEIV
jgi:ribosomal protein L7/L12